MLKRTFILLTAGLSILGYADDRADNEQYCCPLLPPEPIGSCQLPVGYFPPAQYVFQNCCTDITLGGEFIYWEANFDGLPQVATNASGTVFTGTGNLTVFKLLTQDQGYRPGFKIFAGIGFPRFDNWEMNAEYTWLHHTSTNRFNAETDGFIISRFVPQLAIIPASSLRSVQKLNLDFCSLTLGRSFYLSQRLIVRPFVGLKSWWASQRHDLFFDITLFPGAPQTILFTKSGLWGVGPYVGSYIQGLLWCGTYLIGKAGVWPVYTRLNKYRTFINYPLVFNFPPPNFPGLVYDERNIDQPSNTQMMYEGMVGLGWGTYFCNCNYHLDFSVGWELMTNWELQLGSASGLPMREFYYQGLSVKAQLDF